MFHFVNEMLATVFFTKNKITYIDYKDGTQLKVEALAKVKAYVELSYTTQYTENHFEFVRSGKMQEVNCIKIFNKEFSNDFVLNFEHCEIEQNSNYVFNNFILPIKRVKTVYYELIKKQVYVPFEKVKENILERFLNQEQIKHHLK